MSMFCTQSWPVLLFSNFSSCVVLLYSVWFGEDVPFGDLTTTTLLCVIHTMLLVQLPSDHDDFCPVTMTILPGFHDDFGTLPWQFCPISIVTEKHWEDVSTDASSDGEGDAGAATQTASPIKTVFHESKTTATHHLPSKGTKQSSLMSFFGKWSRVGCLADNCLGDLGGTFFVWYFVIVVNNHDGQISFWEKMMCSTCHCESITDTNR